GKPWAARNDDNKVVSISWADARRRWNDGPWCAVGQSAIGRRWPVGRRACDAPVANDRYSSLRGGDMPISAAFPAPQQRQNLAGQLFGPNVGGFVGGLGMNPLFMGGLTTLMGQGPTAGAQIA